MVKKSLLPFPTFTGVSPSKEYTPKKMPTQVTDRLLDRCLRGEAAAQRELYQRELPAVLNLVLRLVGNRPEAEDITQECFLRVFTRLSSFRRDAQLSTWIKRIAINLSLEHVRKRKRITFVPVEEQHLGQVMAPAPAPEVDANRLHAAIVLDKIKNWTQNNGRSRVIFEDGTKFRNVRNFTVRDGE